jgi:hypothetical protein
MADDTEGSGGGKQPQISLVGLFLACMVAGGVQYGWALQLSLLTPYVQVRIYVCCMLVADEHDHASVTLLFFPLHHACSFVI